MKKEKSWFRRHWILTTFGAIFILAIILGMTSEETISVPEKTIETNSSKENIPLNTPANIEEKSETSKLEECENLCEKVYDAQGQIDGCQFQCQNTEYFSGEEKLDILINRMREKLE